MASIQSKLDRLQKLEEQIESEKEKIHSSFGEEVIKELNIDYESLDTKKEMKSVVQQIIDYLDSSYFESSEQNEEKIQNNNFDSETFDTNEVNHHDREISQ